MSLIVLSFVLGFTFFALEALIGRIKTLQSVMLVSLAVAVVGWVGIRNPFILWTLRLCIVIFLVKCILTHWKNVQFFPAIFKSGYVLTLGVVCSVIPQKFIFFLFAGGYDNSSHLGFLYRTWVIGSYEYGLEGNGKILPAYSNLANAYPSLQMESWASLLHILSLSIGSSETLLRYFFFFSILTILLLVYVLISFVEKITKENYLLILGISIFILFSSISVIFWMGFPPTVWGIIFALMSLRVMLATNHNPSHQLLLASISFVLVLYSYQLFAPAFLAVYFYLLFKIVRRKKEDQFNFAEVLLSLLILVFPSSLLLSVSSRISSNSFVFAQGGITLPNVGLIAMLVVLSAVIFIFCDKKMPENKLFFVTIGTNSLLSIFLIGTGVLLNQGVYYPIKSLYLSLFFLISFIVWTASTKQTPYFKNFPQFRILVAILFLAFSSLAWLSPNKGPWYGNSVDLIRSIPSLNNGSYAPYPAGCLNQVFQIATRATNFNRQNNLIAVKVDAGSYGDLSDLVSRWANSLNGRIDENVIALGMSIGVSDDFYDATAKFEENHLYENIIVHDSLTACTQEE